MTTALLILAVSAVAAGAGPSSPPDNVAAAATWIQILVGIAVLAAIFWRGGRLEAKQDSMAEKVSELHGTFRTHIEDDAKFHREITEKVGKIDGRLAAKSDK